MKRLLFIVFLAYSQHSHGSPLDELVLQMNAIAHVESNDDHKKVNRKTDAVGWLQIRRSMVREANRIVGFRKFTYGDRYSKQKQKEIFRIVIMHHNPSLNLRTTCKIWNGGGKNKFTPQWYIKRVIKKHSLLAHKKRHSINIWINNYIYKGAFFTFPFLMVFIKYRTKIGLQPDIN